MLSKPVVGPYAGGLKCYCEVQKGGVHVNRGRVRQLHGPSGFGAQRAKAKGKGTLQQGSFHYSPRFQLPLSLSHSLSNTLSPKEEELAILTKYHHQNSLPNTISLNPALIQSKT